MSDQMVPHEGDHMVDLDPTLLLNSYSLKNKVQSTELQLTEPPEKEKKATTTSARASAPEGDRTAPWSWERHLYLCDQHRKWRARLPAEIFEDPDREASSFFGEFGFSIEVFRAAQEAFQYGPNFGQHAVGEDHHPDETPRPFTACSVSAETPS